MSKHYEKEPEITFQRIMCPFCGEASGPESQCYNIEGKQKSVQQGKSILPIYSESCYFRQNYSWKATINYVVSEAIIKNLGDIEGIEQISAISKYTFTFAVNPLFDQIVIKTKIVDRFRNFIKERQAIEKDNINDNKLCRISIIMPNGQKYNFQGTEDQCFLQRNIFNDIAEKISNVKIENN